MLLVDTKNEQFIFAGITNRTFKKKDGTEGTASEMCLKHSYEDQKLGSVNETFNVELPKFLIEKAEDLTFGDKIRCMIKISSREYKGNVYLKLTTTGFDVTEKSKEGFPAEIPF